MNPDVAVNTARRLRRALDHASEVCNRAHIVASTPYARLGFFKTCWRQAGQHLPGDVLDLSRGVYWQDLGVLQQPLSEAHTIQSNGSNFWISLRMQITLPKVEPGFCT